MSASASSSSSSPFNHYKEVAKFPELPVDHLQGVAHPCGTAAYSNAEPVNPPDSFERYAVDGWAGVAHQCVCFARRILWNRFGYILPDINVAAQIFYIPYVFDANLKKQPVRAVRNGTKEKPTENSFIIYASHLDGFPGHIAWISNVDDERIYVADQNRYHHDWNGKSYSSSFPLVHDKKTGTWTIQDDEEYVIGWVTFPNAPALEDKTSENSEETPKIYPRSDKSKHKHPNGRPMPQSILDNFPSYEPSFMRWSWWYVMKEFRPHPILFPFIFIYMVTKFLVYYPLKMKFYKMMGWNEDNKPKEVQKKE